jgi:hypothetical protein
MRLAIIDDATGIVHTVVEDIDQFNLDKTMARAEVAIAVQLTIGNAIRSRPVPSKDEVNRILEGGE